MPSQKPHSRLLVINDPHPMRICKELAIEIGYNESVVLLQIEFLISISNTEEHDGDIWTYQTLEDLRDNYFPWWSIPTISRILASLKAQGLIKIGNYNKAGYDRTQWFALNAEGINGLKSIRMDDAIFQNEKWKRAKCKMDARKMKNAFFNLKNPSAQNVITIPETPTETPTEITSEISAEEDAPANPEPSTAPGSPAAAPSPEPVGGFEDRIPETPLEAGAHPDIQVFREVCGRIPGSHEYALVIDTVRLLRRRFPDKDPTALADHLTPYWLAWSTRRRANGQPYSKSNLTWLTEWAVNGEIPPAGGSPPAQKDFTSVWDKVAQEMSSGNR